MKSTAAYIEELIKGIVPGELIFQSDFHGLATDNAIRQIIFRLVKKGLVKKISNGIFYKPELHPKFGELKPDAEKVAMALAKRDRVRIRPSGGTALNKLGISTQVPTKLTFATDGRPRIFKVGNVPVRFKATTSKKLSTTGEISSLVIQALDEMDIDKIDPQTCARLKELIAKENPEILKEDLKLTSGRINNFIIQLLKDTHTPTTLIMPHD